MAKKRATEGTDLSKIHVRLKPFLGMRPGLYLTFLYAFILLLIIFLVLFLPGIRHWGSRLIVRTTPEGAAVYVDGTYEGATPKGVFVPAGMHDLLVRKPFYATVDNKVDIGGRLIGTLFAPRTETYDYQLTLSDLPGLLSHSFHDLSQWALIDRVLPNYQLPPILEQTVAGALQSTHFSDRRALWRFLQSAMGDVHNQYLLKDFTNAVSALAGTSAVATPSRLLATLEGSLQLGSRYPDVVLWLAYSLPEKEKKQFEATAEFAQAEKAYSSRLSTFRSVQQPGGGTIAVVDGMRFVRVPGGSYIMGSQVGKAPTVLDLSSANLPHIVQVPSYYMLTTEVTHAQYSRFVSQNPKWAPTAAASLAEQGLANQDYLKGWATYRGPDYPQDYVSFYAAQAFCQWLQARLPISLAGYTVRLPTAREWEWAARMDVSTDRSVFHQGSETMQPAGTGAANAFGIHDLLGNLWEWMSNWYLPAGYFLTSRDGSASLTSNLSGSGAEKAVRGGSWASSRDSVSYTTRGSQPPDWCTPYLGFRPIIVKP